MKKEKIKIDARYEDISLKTQLEKYDVFTVEEIRKFCYLLATIKHLKSDLWIMFGLNTQTCNSYGKFEKYLQDTIKFRLNRKENGKEYLT